MIKEKDINILKEQIRYINSKGKRVKRKPQSCLGAFYIIEAAYKDFIYGSFQYIPGDKIVDKKYLSEARQTLMNKILIELTPKKGC